jgi:uncharacterized membrane protein
MQRAEILENYDVTFIEIKKEERNGHLSSGGS